MAEATGWHNSLLSRIREPIRHVVKPQARELFKKHWGERFNHMSDEEITDKLGGYSRDEFYDMGANYFADWISSLAFAAHTTYWAKMEVSNLHNTSRLAVAAEMGREEKDIHFWDYFFSNNEIAKDEAWYILKLNAARYGMNFAQIAYHAYREIRYNGHLETILDAVGLHDLADRYPRVEKMPKVPDDFDLTFGLMGPYYIWEMVGKNLFKDFEILKSGHYELAKLKEKQQDVDLDVGFNDIYAIYQRTLKQQDMMPLQGGDKNQIRPLIEYMAKLCNADLPEKPGEPCAVENPFGRHVVLAEEFDYRHVNYLIGNGMISAETPEAFARSVEAIDCVAQSGLRGIAKENNRTRKGMGSAGKAAACSASQRGEDPMGGTKERVVGAAAEYDGLLTQHYDIALPASIGVGGL